MTLEDKVMLLLTGFFALNGAIVLIVLKIRETVKKKKQKDN